MKEQEFVNIIDECEKRVSKLFPKLSVFDKNDYVCDISVEIMCYWEEHEEFIINMKRKIKLKYMLSNESNFDYDSYLIDFFINKFFYTIKTKIFHRTKVFC
jgi:hypothetical protein